MSPAPGRRKTCSSMYWLVRATILLIELFFKQIRISHQAATDHDHKHLAVGVFPMRRLVHPGWKVRVLWFAAPARLRRDWSRLPVFSADESIGISAVVELTNRLGMSMPGQRNGIRLPERLIWPEILGTAGVAEYETVPWRAATRSLRAKNIANTPRTAKATMPKESFRQPTLPDE